MDDLKYTVSLEDQTAATLAKVNERLAEVEKKSAVKLTVDAGPASAGIAKVETETAGALQRIDRGLWKTFGGVGDIFAGNFSTGLNKIAKGIQEMTGKSDEAFGKMAIKAGAVAAAFGAGWKIGKWLDEALGISDKIAAKFKDLSSWPFDNVRKLRDDLKAAGEVSFEKLKKELDAMNESVAKTKTLADIDTKEKVAAARAAGDVAAEEKAKAEGIAKPRAKLDETIADKQKRLDEIEKDAREKQATYDAWRETIDQSKKMGATETSQKTAAQARKAYDEAQAAKKRREKEGQELEDQLFKDRVAARELDVAKANLDFETADRRQKDLEKRIGDRDAQEQKEIDESNAEFDEAEKQAFDKAAREQKRKWAEEDKRDREAMADAQDRQAQAQKDFDKAKEYLGKSANERAAYRRAERDAEQDERDKKRREDLAKKAYDRAKKRAEESGTEFDPTKLGGPARAHWQKNEAEKRAKQAEADALAAKAAIEKRELLRIALEEDIVANTKATWLSLWRIEDQLTLG
jgi:hypothetical protein